MHQLIHSLTVTWFQWVQDWGYLGVFILMAMESSIFPVPSELVLPPAAFWASQGKMDFTLVVLTGTLGSYFGSIVTYWVSRAAGRPLVYKYGKYFLLSEAKLNMSEKWIENNGIFGIFYARILPVIRHLISIPAGVFKMDVKKFSLVTLIGAGTWCFILSWFGKKVLGDEPTLLNSPETMIQIMRHKLLWLVVGVAVLAVLTFVMKKLSKK